VAFTAAAELIVSEMEIHHNNYQELRNNLITKLSKLNKDLKVEGSNLEQQLPHIVGLSFAQLQGQYIMLECNRYNIAISTGSACQVGKQSPSRTMKSMGKSDEQAAQFVRLSFGKETEEKDINEFVNVMNKIL